MQTLLGTTQFKALHPMRIEEYEHWRPILGESLLPIALKIYRSMERPIKKIPATNVAFRAISIV
jgi:hypothetical protein